MGAKILLVGSTGYVGNALKNRMKETGLDFATLDRVKGGDKNTFSVTTSHGTSSNNLTDPSFFTDSFSPDWILNLAADVSKSQSPKDVVNLIDANSTLPGLLGSHAQQLGKDVKILHLGTYSYKSDTSDYQPQTFYAASKFSGEKFLEYFSREIGVRVCIFHSYDIYGPKQPHERLVPSTIKKIMDGDKIATTPGEQEFRPLYVEDLIKVLISSFDNEDYFFSSAFNQFDIYGPETFLVRDIPQIIAKKLPKSAGEFVHELSKPYTGNEIMYFNPCHSLPEIDFAWTRFDEGLEKIITDMD